MIADSGPRPWVAVLTLALLTLIWGTTWGVIRIGLAGIPPFAGVALRFSLAGVILVLVARLAKAPLGDAGTGRWLWLVHGFFSLCVSYGVVYWAEQWIASGLASVLFATYTLFVALLAHRFVPGERLAGRSLVGVAIGFCGVVVLFSEDLTVIGGIRGFVAAAVMLLSPLAAAIGSVAVKRWGERSHPISLNAKAMLFAGAAMGLLAAALERDRALTFDVVSVGALLYLAVFGSAVTFCLYFWLMRHLPVSRLALIAYVIPIVAVAVGVLFLGEPLTFRLAIGAAAVLVGVGLAAGAGRRH